MPLLQTPLAVIQLRAALPKDEPFLFELFASEKRAELAMTGLPEIQVEMLTAFQYRGRSMTYAAQYPDAENSILLRDDGTPVGRLLVDRKPACWRIVDIAVLPAHRGKGLATAALKECQTRCGEAGARLELQVAPMNPARRLYKRLGFRATGEDTVEVAMVWRAAM